MVDTMRDNWMLNPTDHPAGSVLVVSGLIKHISGEFHLSETQVRVIGWENNHVGLKHNLNLEFEDEDGKSYSELWTTGETLRVVALLYRKLPEVPLEEALEKEFFKMLTELKRQGTLLGYEIKITLM